MAYELLVLDVDGTLVNTKKKLQSEQKRLCGNVRTRGSRLQLLPGGAQRASAIRQKRLDLTGSAAMLFHLTADALQILQPVK